MGGTGYVVSPATSRGWHRIVLGIALAGCLVIFTEMLLTRTPAHIVDGLLVFLALIFLVQVRPVEEQARCVQCGATEDPVRSPDGRRFWTCRACGFERPRRRSRLELGRRSGRQPN